MGDSQTIDRMLIGRVAKKGLTLRKILGLTNDDECYGESAMRDYNLPNKRYQLLYMDPPWSYKSGHQFTANGKITSAAKAHYPTMSLGDLMAFPIQKIMDTQSCLLFMWVTSPHLWEGMQLANRWGFDYGTVAFCWHKKRHNPGYWTMGEVELCLGFKRGPFPKDRGARNIRQFFSERATAHSAKPSHVRKCIEEMFPNQSKLELFARDRYKGWDVWGLEVDNRLYNPTQKIRQMNEAREMSNAIAK